MYMHISAIQKENWNFKDTSFIKNIISEYKIGEYKFNSII